MKQQEQLFDPWTAALTEAAKTVQTEVVKSLPKPPKPRIRFNRTGMGLFAGGIWVCSLVGAKLNIGLGDTPAGAYRDWYARHGRRENIPNAPVPRPRGFNSDDRL